jgi:hypothetical protein
MVTVTSMGGVRLHRYSYYYKWHEVRWLQLFLQMVLDWMVTVTSTNGMRLDGCSYSYKLHEIGRLQLFLQMA